MIPLVASRPGKELLFTTPKGERIIHKLYWHHYWVPAVKAAQASGLTKEPADSTICAIPMRPG